MPEMGHSRRFTDVRATTRIKPWRLQHLNRRIAMLDHVFLSVSDAERSIAFYVQALAPLGISAKMTSAVSNESTRSHRLDAHRLGELGR
jgi:hypothetical protein